MMFLSLTAFAQKPMLPTDALAVPIVRQETGYSCGAAAMVSVLNYWQVFEGNESDLYKELNTTPENGTHPLKMTEAAKNRGLIAEMRTHLQIIDLKKHLSQGDTVILDIQAWPNPKEANIPWSERWEDGHYVILTGVDASYFYFADPSTSDAYTYMPIDELLPRWHDYEEELDANGQIKIVRNYHLGIIIKGTSPKKSLPQTRRVKRQG